MKFTTLIKNESGISVLGRAGHWPVTPDDSRGGNRGARTVRLVATFLSNGFDVPVGGSLRPGQVDDGSPALPIFPAGSKRLTRRHSQHAFTLIELLLVLVILGILAAIVVPKFSGRTEQARMTAAQTQISTFSTALAAFEVDNGYFPKGKNGLYDLVQAPRDAQSWRGPYMDKEIPLDPWNHPYVYECPGKHNPSSFDLMSIGPDGRAGSEDDITNWQTQKR